MVLEWHAVCQENDVYRGSWRGLPANLLHSFALARMMSGTPLFVERPPTRSGYPDYEALAHGEAPLRINPEDVEA